MVKVLKDGVLKGGGTPLPLFGPTGTVWWK